jgi:hypothetical protein
VDAELVFKRFEVIAAGIEQHLPTITRELLTAGFETVRPIAQHIKQEALQRATDILGTVQQ